MNIQPLVDAVRQAESDNIPLNITYYENVVWSYEEGELAINAEGNEDHLANFDGETYTFEVGEGIVTEDGYVVFYDADNGCGTRDTVIVSANERAMWE